MEQERVLYIQKPDIDRLQSPGEYRSHAPISHLLDFVGKGTPRCTILCKSESLWQNRRRLRCDISYSGAAPDWFYMQYYLVRRLCCAGIGPSKVGNTGYKSLRSYVCSIPLACWVTNHGCRDTPFKSALHSNNRQGWFVGRHSRGKF